MTWIADDGSEWTHQDPTWPESVMVVPPVKNDQEDIVGIPTDQTAYQLADSAIGLFLEFRDVHGYDERAARSAAAVEIVQGVQAEVELREVGELPPLKPKT